MKLHLLVLTFVLAGCTAEKPIETAESRANTFVYAILNQNPKALWESLAPSSKEGIAKLAGLSVNDPDVATKAFSLAGRWRSLVSLKPIKANTPAGATEATVVVESLAGEKMELKLIKLNEGWRVYLPVDQYIATPAPASVPASTPASAPVATPSSTSAPASTPTSSPLQ